MAKQEVLMFLLVQRKQVIKGTLKKKFVRMSFSGRAGFEHRVSRRDMIALKEEYNRQKNNPMSWDRKED